MPLGTVEDGSSACRDGGLTKNCGKSVGPRPAYREPAPVTWGFAPPIGLEPRRIQLVVATPR
jgi:hypothetical protein